MPININRAFKNAIIIGMIGVMGMVTLNKGIFMHTHKIGDNIYISHSHPYNKSDDSNPYKSHHHTKEEFLFFQNIEILFPFFFLAVSLIALSTKSYFVLDIRTGFPFVFLDTNRGRAPPVL